MIATLAPSRISRWRGRPAAGSLWSIEQIATMERQRRDPATIATGWIELTVYPGGDQSRPPTSRRLLVPILARTRRGNRALIITPGGDELWRDLA